MASAYTPSMEGDYMLPGGKETVGIPPFLPEGSSFFFLPLPHKE